MANYRHISIIGSGNIATNLATAFENAGHYIHEIYSRNPGNAKALLKKLYSASLKETLDFSGSSAEIFILAIPDHAIAETSANLTLPPAAILVHTSGSVPIESLAGNGIKRGVFYPLQTFSKSHKITLKNVAICIEGEDATTAAVLKGMAATLSSNVHELNSHERFVLHLSAVFASNFTNHLLLLSQQILEKNKLRFELLTPLIVETMNKALDAGPAVAQTGPARRGDLEVLDRHMEYLKSEENVAEIYQILSQHILDSYLK